MDFALELFPQFVDDYREYFSYLREFDEATAVKHFRRFENELVEILVRDPLRYAFFKETGAPYRAKLFRVGRKTFWIIYTIDDGVVSLRRFWDIAREPGRHGLT